MKGTRYKKYYYCVSCKKLLGESRGRCTEGNNNIEIFGACCFNMKAIKERSFLNEKIV